MIDKTDLRIEAVNEYCIVNGKNQVVKDGFYSEEEAAKWLDEVYGVKNEPKAQLNLNEQVKELREIAKNWNPNIPINPVSVVLNRAADTIESLSAKLQAANMERSADCGGWIPCKERLPEEKINPVTDDFYEYEVTFKQGNVTDIRHYKFGRGHWWNGPGIMDEYVVAWRKNLEPYHEP